MLLTMATGGNSGEQDYKLNFNRKKVELNEIMQVFSKNCFGPYEQLRLQNANEETYCFKSRTEDEKVQRFGKTMDDMEQDWNREQIKIAVFGTTSSGKSTTLHALLGENLLRTGRECTTKCVTQIMRSNDHIPRLITDDVDNYSFSCTNDLVDYLACANLDSCREMKIYLPNEADCVVLEENIVLIDMPGTDYQENLDNLVKKYCFDCDVFVLVVNSESGLGYKTRDYYVNLFKDAPLYTFYVVFNKWDIMIEDAKQQNNPQDYEKDKRNEYMEDGKRFLEAIFNHKKISVDSLENFVCFLSAIYAFADQLNKKQTADSKSFETFVRHLLNSGSQAALQRKLQYHKSSVLKMMMKDFDEYMIHGDIWDCQRALRKLWCTLEERKQVIRAVKIKIHAGKDSLLVESKARLQSLIEEVIKVLEAQKNVATSQRLSVDEYYSFILDRCGVRDMIRLTLEGLNDLYKSYKNEIVTTMLELINNLDDYLGINNLCVEEEDKGGKPCANEATPSQETAAKTTSSSPKFAQVDKNLFLKDVHQEMKNIMVGLDVDEERLGICMQEISDEFDEIVASNDECCSYLEMLFSAKSKNDSIMDTIKEKVADMFNTKPVRELALNKLLSDSFNLFCDKIECMCKKSLRFKYITESIEKQLKIQRELKNIQAQCLLCERKLSQV